MKYQKGSFIIVPNKQELRKVSLGARAIFIEMCDMADTDGICFPSRALLGERIMMSVDSVDRFINELLEGGFVTKTRRMGLGGDYTSNLYQVMALAVPMPLPSRTDTATPSRTHAQLTVSNRTLPTEWAEDCEPVETSDSEEYEKPSKVIPTPYSIERTREAWKNGERRLQVLEWYLAQAGLWKKATTKDKLKAIMARHSNAAKRIAKAEWTSGELKQAKQKIELNESLHGEWTLDTIEKYLVK